MLRTQYPELVMTATWPENVSAVPEDSSLTQAIRLIGVGKNGSKPLPDELIQSCQAELQSGGTHPLQRGAFWGALLTKGPTPAERQLEALVGKGAFSHPTFFIHKVCPDLPMGMLPIATKLLKGHTLRVSEAHQLGEYLFKEGESEVFKGLAASILRVRHETNDEYVGLMEAAKRTFTPGFKTMSCASRPLVQLAEPFDGVDHSFMITPLLAGYIRQRGYGTVSMVSRSGGPKYTLNAYDLFVQLGCTFAQSNHELCEDPGPYGWVVDQKALSPALDRWVDRRRLLLKRPFLATMEKLLNPCHARILVTSVFHITYQMKMAELALLAGFDGVIVMKRGLEGTLAPSTSRASGILCAVRTAKGHLFFQHFDTTAPGFQSYKTESDDVVDTLYADENARLIRKFMAQRVTGNIDFDNRVRLAEAMLDRGLDWIEGQLA